MNFALDKNGFLQFRGDNLLFVLEQKTNEGSQGVCDLTWSTHIEEQLPKAVRLFHYAKRNTSLLTLTHPKLSLYKSLILFTISYASPSIYLTKASISKV